MEGPLNSQQHGSTRQSPSLQQGATKAVTNISGGLDMFDIQLQNDCANVPGSFMGNLNGNAAVVGLPPSPPVTSAAMFSSIATATHGLASAMSNPQTARRMVQEVAQVILRFVSTPEEPQPENLTDECGRHLILQFVDELQRSTATVTTGMTSGGDGRLTIDKEVVLSLKNGREDLPPPGAEVARPHHPYAGYCGVLNAASPRTTTQLLLRGTPPNFSNVAQGSNSTSGSTNANINNLRSSHGAMESFSPAGVGAAVHQQPGLTVTLLSKRVSGGDVFRPRPQHPRSGNRTLMINRRVMTSTKKVLRSASSAFSECSAGETGEVSSSMSRTTIGTSALAK
ncbi:hypothetical protein TraAM80_04896 [Trypanosoma rangeli]|uniref:Uncharacterized protein n=1 Tax=Trypanosoma rangeli TaxID=5698 RepID=A0A3R7KZW3_TRYRA|nr:uncharacterized protein TraAM80_04896 [Trypanosoma rangeli]RNF04754.1 hypothetical protein TraAM80_04896 [Trypanosoma rangeli]|eukprot:RNF04754.1 hypothetical protein TraAM80_04896 [Trypanosoma rangeli]